MKNYEKPDILRVENLSEGVYLASGEAVCGSQYLKGNWIKPWGTSNGTMKQVRGCEGCSADDGEGCKIQRGLAQDLNSNGDFKPEWERRGYKPDDSPWYN